MVNDLVQLRGKEEEIGAWPWALSNNPVSPWARLLSLLANAERDAAACVCVCPPPVSLAEYGPVRYEVRRVGFTPKAELINGRIAMMSITVASIYSYFDGSLLTTILDGRLPQAWF